MSEQTPENLSEREPSMEDILASIRKIIADDSPGESSPAGDQTSATPKLVVSETPSALSEPEPFDLTGIMDIEIDDDSTQDLLDMVEFDLTDDLAESGTDGNVEFRSALEIPDIQRAGDTPTADLPGSTDILDLTDILDMDGEDADADISDALDAYAPITPAPEPAQDDDPVEAPKDALSESEDDDLDALLNDLIMEDSVAAEDTGMSTVSEPSAPPVTFEDTASDDGHDILDIFDADDMETSDTVSGKRDMAGSAVSQDDDIDLVKSLMADLTEDNDHDQRDDDSVHAKSDDDIDTVLLDTILDGEDDDLAGISAISDADAALDSRPEPIRTEVGFDELSDLIADLQADTREAQARAQSVQSAPVLDISDDVEAADETQTASDVTGTAPLATAIAVAPAAGDIADDFYDTDDSAADEVFDTLIDEIVMDDAEDIDNDTQRDSHSASETTSSKHGESDNQTTHDEQEDDMSAAKGREAISSRDTYEDTSSAFASLGKVVEEKAVFAERGPRIGDLVQEALRPMLQEWLDANLKTIVDRAVAKEIKRISGGK